jgi:hypothetical protein
VPEQSDFPQSRASRNPHRNASRSRPPEGADLVPQDPTACLGQLPPTPPVPAVNPVPHTSRPTPEEDPHSAHNHEQLY